MTLFGDPEPEEVVLSIKAMSTSVAPVWTRHSGKDRCADCVQVNYENNRTGRGNWQMPRQAQWKRTTRESEVLLCTGHADLWKQADEREFPS